MTKDQLKILLLEDRAEDVALVERILNRGSVQYEIRNVDEREEFETSLKEFTPDIILSDHTLPQFNSIEALRITRQFDPNLPFILVTGTISEEVAVKVLRHGADDYILKESLIRLPEAIKNALTKQRVRLEKQKAEEELFAFLHKVSHDIKSPLGSIAKICELALSENPDEASEEKFEMIQTTSHDLQKMLQALIQGVSIKHETSDPEYINIQTLVKEVLARIQYMDGYDRVDIKVEAFIDKGFYSNKALMSSIIQNLLENAIKYQDTKKKKSWIHIKASEKENRTYIEIADNGVGIPVKSQSKIFEKFFRANQKKSGTGVGLYIVKQAIDKLNGNVTVKSVPGEGTTFTLQLPDLSAFRSTE